MKSDSMAVTNYIGTFRQEIQERLLQIRKSIQNIAPEATESISYGIPAYQTNGKPLIYFAAFKNHIGLYATPTGHNAFEKELVKYKQGKGSVQFPLDQPLPIDLIERIVKFRQKENNDI